MMKFMFRNTAERKANELMIRLLYHSQEYELIEDKERKRFVIFRNFGETLDGSGDYRGLIACFSYKMGLHR